MAFRVQNVDHIEMFVPDRHEAVAWYQRVLGLELVPELRDWCDGGGGPCMISADGGVSKLALFDGEPQGSRPTAGFHRVAFRVSGDGFIEFLRGLGDLDLRDDRGRRVAPDAAVDHERSFSIYFVDPYGHRLEVTTYDYAATEAALVDMGVQPR